MNIITEEYDSPVTAKTCGCNMNKRKVAYSFLSESHSLCLDRKDLIGAQLKACNKLIKYADDEDDRRAVEKEINELKMTRPYDLILLQVLQTLHDRYAFQLFQGK